MITPPQPIIVDIDSVLILKADRVYAEALQQLVCRTFPRAKVRLAWSVPSAMAALSAEKVELLVTGAGASIGGDVLELLAPSVQQPRAAKHAFVITGCREFRTLAGLRAIGVEGVFDSSTEPPETLACALQTVAAGGQFWSPSIVDHLRHNCAAATSLLHVLSVFEQVVLSVVAAGCDDSTAADELGLSPTTISTVRRDLHRKLGVQHRGELVRIAAQHGFVRFTPFGVIRPGYSLLTAAYRPRKARRPQDSGQSANPFCIPTAAR